MAKMQTDSDFVDGIYDGDIWDEGEGEGEGEVGPHLESAEALRVEEAQSQLISRIINRDIHVELENEQEAACFQKEYESCFVGGEQGTLIHMALRYCRDSDFGVLKPLFALLIRIFPSLLEERNQQGETVLHYAILRRLSEVTEYLCKCAGQEAAQRAVICRGQNGGNCVHSAIKLNLDVAKYLISVSEPDALMARDRAGNTPLHLAVYYARCRIPSNERMVEMLIDRCPAAAYILNEDGLSPYGYHLLTIEVAGKLSRRGRETPSTEGGRRVDERRAVEKQETQLETQLPRVMNSTGVREGPRGSKTTRHQPEVADPRAASAAIQEMLKLLYFRNCPREDCLKFLYGESRTQVKEIDFDLGGASSVTEDLLDNMSRFLNFESILRYVFLPDGCLQQSSKKRDRGLDSRGKDDFGEIFDWLRHNGVKKIIRVVVRDSRETPHSEEAIDRALHGFGVEELDWMKDDICSETINSAIPDVQMLHLYWSGSNPVLRAWSEPEGLPRLRKLKKVIVTVSLGLETMARTHANVRVFARRLSWTRSDIEFTCNFQDSNVRIQAASMSPFAPRGTEAPWLWHMHNLAIFLKNLDPHDIQTAIQGGQSTTTTEFSLPTIKICLVDDGVDPSVGIVGSLLAKGISFSRGQEFSDMAPSWYTSSKGHGAKMAQIMSMYSARAELYIARVDEANGKLEENQVMKALNWAIKLNVDIICVGQPIQVWKQQSIINDKLGGVFELSKKRSIPVFCASLELNSTGKNWFEALPYSTVTRIRPCVPLGSHREDAGDRESYAFPTAGLKGNSDKSTDIDLDDDSSATALACALAALTLYIAHISPSQEVRLAEMGNRRVVETAFRALTGPFMGRGLVNVARLSKMGGNAEGMEKVDYMSKMLFQ